MIPVLSPSRLRLSIIVPALNEAAGIAACLAALTGVRRAGCEVVVVDGGSSDGTAAAALPWCDRVVTSERGRGVQLNAGAAAARTDRLLFLHADTRLPEGALDAIEDALGRAPYAWGRFDVALDSPRRLLRVVACMMNLRSRLTGIATGDQAMFMTRAAFDAAGGFPPIPLMEDVAMSTRLKRLAAPHCLRMRVSTSARRWEADGAWRTIVLMWRLRLAYFLGADPADLARRYRR
ncbi:MAG: TIGR04283 family arsenosugar biosynthesis glycosyltransferase [Burkholderiales bacterium]|nr:TIGR04283 family arsenosugar biosynthesis glycosyltransferase [Burkholderiales bacterium]